MFDLLLELCKMHGTSLFIYNHVGLLRPNSDKKAFNL